LLSSGAAKEIWLNDADPCIYSFWLSIFKMRRIVFIERINIAPLTIQRMVETSRSMQISQ